MARKVATRTCIVCRRAGDKRELTRVVRAPDGQIACDASGRMPGRGAYVCNKAACMEKALAAHKFNAALRCKLTAEDEQHLRDEFTALVVASAEASKEGE